MVLVETGAVPGQLDSSAGGLGEQEALRGLDKFGPTNGPKEKGAVSCRYRPVPLT